jgi:ABC-type spermidine/putrescine transport system permease subunit II
MLRWGVFGLVAFVFVAPLGVLVIASGAGVWVWPSVLPQSWTGGAWWTVIASDAFVSALVASVGIAVAVTAFAFVLCWYAAFGLAHSDARGMRTIVLAVCYAPLVVPPFLPLIGTHRWLIRLGWSDSVWGVIAVTVPLVVPYVLHALLLGLDTISAQWRDVARMLGASVFAQQRTLLAMLLWVRAHRLVEPIRGTLDDRANCNDPRVDDALRRRGRSCARCGVCACIHVRCVCIVA